MFKIFLYVLLFSFSINSVAQKSYYTKSMQVTEYDLKGVNYPKDSTANAFYIYEKGFSRIIKTENNYLHVATDYERKIKILNKEGYKSAKINVYLYKGKNRSEKIKNLVAHTYNLEDGTITETAVKEDNIYKDPYSETLDVVRFTFPDLKPGSVIKYSYQIVSPYVYNFNGWDFQDDIPKQYSEYISDLPGNYIYNIRLVGTQKLTTEESSVKKKCLKLDDGLYADCAHNKYTMEDIPAFREEKYMTAKKNYFSRVAYELKEFKGFNGIDKKFTETWTDVDNKLKKNKSIGLQLKKINITKDLLPLNISSSVTNLEKAKNIYRYITKDYTWNEEYQIFTKTSIKEIIKNKIGNVGSINILLHNILKQQGFSVKPVLLSTRENGYATKIHPVLSDFNYILVQLIVDDQTYLLDATEKNMAFGQIPFRCLNKYGRLIDFSNGSSWTAIKPQNRSVKYYREQIKLTAENKLHTSCTFLYSGYYALNKRKTLHGLSEEKKYQIIIPVNDQIEIIDKKIIDEDVIDNPVVEEFSFTTEPEKIDDIIYIKPFTKPFFRENPFKLNERTYPVDFGNKKYLNYVVSIEVPEKYLFLDIPKNTHYILPENQGKLVTSYKLENKKLLIAHQITLSSSYYPTEFYSSLKDLFNYIIDIENNTVITVKKVN